MRFTRPAIVAFAIAVTAPPGLVTRGFAQTCACPPSEGALPSTVGPTAVGPSVPLVYAEEPPPPLPDYDQPPMPAPGYYWTPGYWAWNNVDYYWVPGVWIEPPRPGLLWTPGYWSFVGGVYAFHRGYWAHEIGFYGGVNYGFGYFGRGYEGGRWEGDRFFYNTAVNNIGSVQVTNVYRIPVVVNNITNVTNISYNGGPTGIRAVPTPQEQRLAAQPHIPPTQLQRDQVRAASLRPEQFVSTNQGKPPVAATPRPVDFKAAVPAKAPGGPIGPNHQPLPPNAAARTEQKPPAVVIPRLGGTPGAQPAIIAPGETTQPGRPARTEERLPQGAAPALQQPGAPKPGERLPAVQVPVAQPNAPQVGGPPKRAERLPQGAAPIVQQPRAPKPGERQPAGQPPVALPYAPKPGGPPKPGERTPATGALEQPPALQRQQELQQRQEQQRQQQLLRQQQDQTRALQQQQLQQRQQQMMRQQEQDQTRALQQQQRALQQEQQMRQQQMPRPPAQVERRPVEPGGRSACGQPGLPPCPRQ